MARARHCGRLPHESSEGELAHRQRERARCARRDPATATRWSLAPVRLGPCIGPVRTARTDSQARSQASQGRSPGGTRCQTAKMTAITAKVVSSASLIKAWVPTPGRRGAHPGYRLTKPLATPSPEHVGRKHLGIDHLHGTRARSPPRCACHITPTPEPGTPVSFSLHGVITRSRQRWFHRIGQQYASRMP